MRKLSFILMLFILGLPVLAYAPSWSEFCPPQYVNAGEMEVVKPNALVQFLLGASLIGIPSASYRLNNYNNALLNNYWANRKRQFDSEIALGSNSQNNDNKIMYYMNVRQIELDKNNQLKNEQLAQQSLYLQKLQMIQRMNTNSTLNNINSNLNGINNNLYGVNNSLSRFRYGY